MKKTSVKELVLTALFAAMICVLAPLSVPIGPVPISLATFAIMLAGILLGARLGTIATLIYLLLGMVGVPVFAGYTAGVQKLAGPTGGYLVGYVPLAFLCGLLYHRFGSMQKGARKIAWMTVAMLIGTAVLYVLGTAWFCIGMPSALAPALTMCVIPFLPGDAAKIIAIVILAPQIEKGLRRAGAAAPDAA